jgi:error-prone DNA polymerase
VVFLTVEDETATANLIAFPLVYERWRRELVCARLLAVWGRVENQDGVIHLLIDRAADLTPMLATLTGNVDNPGTFPDSRNFH